MITGRFLLKGGSIEQFGSCEEGSGGRGRRGGFYGHRRLAEDWSAERFRKALLCSGERVIIGRRMMT